MMLSNPNDTQGTLAYEECETNPAFAGELGRFVWTTDKSSLSGQWADKSDKSSLYSKSDLSDYGGDRSVPNFVQL